MWSNWIDVLCILDKASATGEVTLAPDVCMFNIVVSSQKDRLQDAKNGVARRLDYILQALNNKHLKVWSVIFISSQRAYVISY